LKRIDPLTFVKYRKFHDPLGKNLQQRSLTHTDNKVATSFTSTSLSIHTKNEIKKLTDNEIRMEYQSLIKSRQEIAQVVLLTNKG
jgi:hypothetical protein